eukprot:1159680-Pelagomonas_calceolata.AAC.8
MLWGWPGLAQQNGQAVRGHGTCGCHAAAAAAAAKGGHGRCAGLHASKARSAAPPAAAAAAAVTAAHRTMMKGA